MSPVQDPLYVKPAPSEFPKVVYHPHRGSKVVNNLREQRALGKGWLVTPQEVHAHLDRLAKAQYPDSEEEKKAE